MNEITRQPQSRSLWGAVDEFDNLFDDFWRPLRAARPGSASGGGAFPPALDVTETDNEYHVRADLPGVKKEDMDISVQDGILTINAETKYEDEKKDGRVIRQERRYGKFVRSMRLGDAVDVDKVKAEYKDGVLDLTLPKAEQVRPKRIDVKVS